MAPRLRRDRMSAIDTAWLRMDRPHNLMIICGVLLFDGHLQFARLRKLVKSRFLVFPRFLQRAVEQPGGAQWTTDEAFDLDRHVVRAKLPGNAGREELEALVSQLIATPLDPAHPMWQFHVVERCDGGSALVARIHHSYADGIALVRVMLSMTDASPDGPPAMPFTASGRRSTPDEAASETLGLPVDALLRTLKGAGATLAQKGMSLLNDPATALKLAGQGSALAIEIAKLALMGQDSPTRFKGRPAVEKRVAWADPLPLDEVKAVGKALAASVNDVLLSCVAGALRAYLDRKGDAVDGITLRALVPVNLRPLEQAHRLGNHFGLVFLDLPIGIENPIERLYAVRENMRMLKGSYQPLLAMGLLAAMGSAPRTLQEALLVILARNATAVMTNVPGPQQPLYMAGRRIRGLMFWVPQSGDIGMGVSILSYDGAVQFGLVTDRTLCPDPEAVIAHFAPEFEKLVLTTLMSPWPRDGDLDPAIAEEVVRIAA